MKWDGVIKAAIIALISISGGSYVTHSHDVAKSEQIMEDRSMSCSEIIQLVIDNKGDR
jgi:hypothetical protein